MRKSSVSLIVFMLVLCSQVYSQVLPDSSFNALLRKYNGGWIAGDATFSIALPGEKTLWLFGDSFIGTVNADSSIVPGSKMIRNCVVLQDGDSMTAHFGGTFNNPSSFIDSTDPDSTWYWPEHGLMENDTLKIFFSEFKLAPGPAGFNFKYSSAYIARFTYPALQLADITEMPYYAVNGVCYGNYVLVEDGYTYIYGRKETDTVYHIAYPHIARAAAGNLTGAWEFFDGTSWVSNPAETFRISSQAVSQEYGVFKLGEKYVLISQEIWLSTKIHSYIANALTGPFGSKKLLYDTPVLYPTSFTYNAFPHIQFNQNDELLVSYNTNGNFWNIFSNVELYRPLFIRVPFTMIDPTYVSVPENLQKKNETSPVILFQNFPNPANHSTRVKIIVNQKEFVSIQLCGNDGKLLRSYVNKILSPGEYDIEMDVRDLKSGIYTYFIHNSSFQLIKD